MLLMKYCLHLKGDVFERYQIITGIISLSESLLKALIYILFYIYIHYILIFSYILLIMLLQLSRFLPISLPSS